MKYFILFAALIGFCLAADNVVVAYARGENCYNTTTFDESHCGNWTTGSQTVAITDGSNAFWEFRTDYSKATPPVYANVSGGMESIYTNSGGFSLLWSHYSPLPGDGDQLDGTVGTPVQVYLDGLINTSVAYYTFTVNCGTACSPAMQLIAPSLIALLALFFALF